jgi:hypothetical protein
MANFRAQAAIELPAATARPLLGQAAIEWRSGATAGSLRGQAAMEYLVTYGWALLALFIVIALLLSSGAFSISSYASQECAFQPDLPCPSFILYKTAAANPRTTLEFTLSNGLGFPIQVNSVTYTATGMGQQGRNIYAGSLPFPSGIIGSGQRMNFTQDFTGSFQPSPRDLKTIYVSITYSNCKGGTCRSNYTTSGRISTLVEKR